MLALAVAVASALLAVSGIFGPAEDALTARRADLLARQPSGEVVIVEIDARSLSQLRSWPWPRQYHAELVRRLDDVGVRTIAFDVDFSARAGSGDAELAAAIRDAEHVILPVFQQKSSDADGSGLIASRPDAAFADAWVGSVNIFPDSDGVLREYPAATFIGGAVQPSIATLVAEEYGLADRSFQPDWGIDARRIPRFSFVDVMRGRVSPDALRDKRVLIGATAIELGDRYAVPRYGVVSGVVVQALAAESLLQDRALKSTALPVTILGILLFALVLAPRPVRKIKRCVALYAGVALLIAVGPVLIQAVWPLAVQSAAWLFTVLASAATHALVEARRRLRLRSEIDAESGLPNRAVLEKALASTSQPPLVVAAAIERFEMIRAGIGIAGASEMIGSAARLIGQVVEAPVYRIAPDVLAWTLPTTGESELRASLRDVRAALHAPVATAEGLVDVILTVGIDADEGPTAPVMRIERALSAIGTARSLGKPDAWYRGGDPLVRRQLSMMSDLRQAMAEGRLTLVYQPKLSLSSGRIADAEALIRWHDPTGKVLSPDEFIPLAESTGVIREVTLFALRAAAADMGRWARQGLRVRVAVNLSALDLATPDFAHEVAALLGEAGVEPSQLALEVTESALIRSPDEAKATLNELRALGIRLSVDDYGTGQSTLSYLKHLPVHELKIDKSFVTGIAHSEGDRIMVRSTTNMAHELGLEVVAEGIEDGSAMDILRQLACDYAQGYFIGRPVGADALAALVRSSGQPRLVA